ncbi:MAG: site-specific integrase [Burkholderiales bacterium]
MKLHLILDEYLDYAERSVVSIARTRSSISSLTRRLGHYDHSRLTAPMLRAYRKDEGLEPASINRDFSVLRAALKQAQGRGDIKVAPDVPKRAGENKRVTWLQPAQVEQLLLACLPYPVLHTFVLLALLTGQRKEAVLSLKWSQVDRARNTVWFGDHDLTFASRRKGRGSVDISPGLARLLDRLANSTPYVLVSSRGSRLPDINWDHWKAATEAAGLTGLTPHDLRHTVATNLIREQVPLIDVSRLLGHSSTAITEEIYVNHQPQFLRPAVAKLDTLAGVA